MSAPDVTFGDKQTGSPFYGRWWKLTVKTAPQNGSVIVLTADSSSDLRVTFDIRTERIKDAFWYADIDVYNLNQETTDLLLRPNRDPRVDPAQIQPGAVVTFEAGYKNGAQGIIWQGPLFQQLWERENVVDFKLTLRCALGLLAYSNENGVSYAVSALVDQAEVVSEIAAAAFQPIPVGFISPNLTKTLLPRGQTFFGDPGNYFDDIADENGMEWFMSMHGLEMSRGNEVDENMLPDLTFASPTPDTMKLEGDNYIIGTPQQTEEGVSFLTLLEPRLHVTPIQRVRIDNSSVRLLKREYSRPPITVLDPDGLYFVAGVRHWGDTRGVPWYSEVTGVTPAYLRALKPMYQQQK
jgi:hypothetical protein